jgi:hypothetical protein
MLNRELANVIMLLAVWAALLRDAKVPRECKIPGKHIHKSLAPVTVTKVKVLTISNNEILLYICSIIQTRNSYSNQTKP